MFLVNQILTIENKLFLTYLLSKNTHEFDYLIGKKKCFVCLGADYGNLGDVAITIAQKKFLKFCFPDYEVVELPISKTFSGMKSMKSVVTKDDIITIVGGGNISKRYKDIEYCREFVIQQFPNNPVISFPQSVDMKEMDSSFLQKMNKIYAKHIRLLFFAREKYTFDFVKSNLPQINCMLSPDIVLSMNTGREPRENKEVIITLRNDKEKEMTLLQEQMILQVAKDYGKVVRLDTQISNHIDISNREEYLNDLLKRYQQSKFVITDRLHGMILSYITNTPCIVFACDNPKIQGCYDWIKESQKTVFINSNNVDEKYLRESIDKIISISAVNKNIDFSLFKEILFNFIKG